MKRHIYFIRHAQPAQEDGKRFCLGSRTDPPLSTFGLMQSCVLGEELRRIKIRQVFSSDLLRAKETASFLCKRYIIDSGLNEIDMGVWDGMDFDSIAAQYPELYARRGEHPELQPPESESLTAAAERFGSAVREILRQTRGDVAIVTHAGVLKAFFHLEQIGYAQYFVTDEKLHLLSGPQSAQVPMTPALCRKLHKAVGLLENIRLHCEAEARISRKIVRALNRCGYSLDENRVFCSALLHDIVRLERNHEQRGGQYLTALGYPEIGDLIRQHFGPDKTEISEAAVLYISDMNTLEHHYVSVDMRFFDSFRRHMLPRYELFRKNGYMDIFEKHRRQAGKIRDLINDACNARVVR